jgi:type IV pilus assembly protein PilE
METTLSGKVIRRDAGMTLIELMIAVVVVAILAAVAYPSYENQLRKGRRASAQTFVVDLANREQQYLLDARSYAIGATALAQLGFADEAAIPADVSKYYTITIGPALATTPPSFTITATPKAGTKQVTDGPLTLDSAGAKTRNGATGW